MSNPRPSKGIFNRFTRGRTDSNESSESTESVGSKLRNRLSRIGRNRDGSALRNNNASALDFTGATTSLSGGGTSQDPTIEPPPIVADSISHQPPITTSSNSEHREESTSNVIPVEGAVPKETKKNAGKQGKTLYYTGVVLSVLSKASEISSVTKPVKLVCDTLKVVVDSVEMSADNKKGIESLHESLETQHKFLETNIFVLRSKEISSESKQKVAHVIEVYLSVVDEIRATVDQLMKANGDERRIHQLVRLLEAPLDEKTVKGSSQRLKDAYSTLTAQITILLILENAYQVEEDRMDEIINRLSNEEEAQGYRHGQRYLKGTRKSFIWEMKAWAANGQESIFTIEDEAGTGKSILAKRMSIKWDDRRTLVGKFFFSRTAGITSGKKLPDTICREASDNLLLRQFICKSIGDKRKISSESIGKKLRLMVFEPLRELQAVYCKWLDWIQAEMENNLKGVELMELDIFHQEMKRRPSIKPLQEAYVEALEQYRASRSEEDKDQLRRGYRMYLLELQEQLKLVPIIVIDALDECDKEDRQEILREFLSFLGSGSSTQLPLKLLVTARINTGLKLDQFPTFSKKLRDDPSDIRLYAEKHLNNVLSPYQMDQFIKQANGLFIWAFVATDLIENAIDKAKMLETLTETTADDERLNLLYKSVIDTAKEQSAGQYHLLTMVLQVICVARTPLTTDTVDEILASDRSYARGKAEDVIARFRSVLSIEGEEKVVEAIHPTFIEYVIRPNDQKPLQITKDSAEEQVVNGCIAILEAWDIGSLHKFVQVGELQEYRQEGSNTEKFKDLLNEATTPGLRYAVTHTIAHVVLKSNNRILDALRALFKNKLLPWIELVSYLQKIDQFMLSIRLESHIYDSLPPSPESRQLREEMEQWFEEIVGLIQNFQDTIQSHATQVYCSALPFAPESGLLREHYTRHKLPHAIPNVIRGAWSLKSRMTVLSGHSAGVHCLAFSRDNRKLATGSNDGTVRLWDAGTGAAIGQALTGHTKPVSCLAFSPDNECLASGSDDTSIRLWDVENRTSRWDALSIPSGTITGLAFNERTGQLATGSTDKRIYLWDVAKMEAVPKPLEGHEARITCLAHSLDGILATGSVDKTVRLWGLGGEELKLLDHSSPLTCLAFSPKGERLVTGSDSGTIIVWNPKSGAQVYGPLTIHTGPITCLAFSPQFSTMPQFASGSTDGSVRLWQVKSNDAQAKAEDFGNAGKEDESILLDGHADSVRCLAYSPDGCHLATGSDDKTVLLWKPKTSETKGTTLIGHIGALTCLAFSPNGERLASGAHEGPVHLWNVHNAMTEPDSFTAHIDFISCLAFSPKGDRIATGSNDKTIRIWSTKTAEPIGGPLIGHTAAITCVAFSPVDNTLATGSSDYTARLWKEAVKEDEAFEISFKLDAHSKPITCLAFSPDGEELATGSGDKSVRLWNTQRGSRGIMIHHSPAAVSSCRFWVKGDQSFLIVNDDSIYQLLTTKSSLVEFPEEAKLTVLASIRFDHPWTYLGISQNSFRFRLPPYFSCYRESDDHVYVYAIYQSTERRGMIAYGGEHGSFIIVDCSAALAELSAEAGKTSRLTPVENSP